MKRFVHPLLLLLARATQKELVQMVEYLKAENRMLRSRLPKRIEATPAERAKLLKLGVRLGSKLKEVITIVHANPTKSNNPVAVTYWYYSGNVRTLMNRGVY